MNISRLDGHEVIEKLGCILAERLECPRSAIPFPRGGERAAIGR